MPEDPGSCAHCKGKWFAMHEGKLRVPHETPFHPGASARVLCVPCFDELSADRVIAYVLEVVRETSAYKAMPWAEQSYLILDLQHMVEHLKGVGGKPPFDESTPVVR